MKDKVRAQIRGFDSKDQKASAEAGDIARRKGVKIKKMQQK